MGTIKHRRHLILPIVILLIAMPMQTAQSAKLRVITSIGPIHSLVASVMLKVGKPDLLIKGTNSPHNFSLKPSDARNLSKANVVFWVGENIEIFLAKPLDVLTASALVVDLSKTPGLSLLAPRTGRVEQRQEKTNLRESSEIDPHFWLNPDNAKVMVEEIVRKLSLADNVNAKQYATNGGILIAKLNSLTSELAATLEPIKTVPYFVYHDAFQYFEKRFNLNAIGTITPGPDSTPGAKKIIEIRKEIVKKNILCVFTEPQFKPAIVKTITRNTSVKLAVLDPLGADIPAGPDAYATLMRTLAGSLVACLTR